MTIQRTQIGVIGYAGSEEYPDGRQPVQRIYDAAEEIGFLLAQNGATVVTGGKSGVMAAAARGAKRAKGMTVGIVKGTRRFTSNEWTDIEVLSGMTLDGFDEVLLVSMCDALIVAGGGAGTLEEIVLAYRNRKPVIALDATGGWAERLSDTFLDERETERVVRAATPRAAVELALERVRRMYAS